MKFSLALFGAALYLFSSAEAGISTDTPFNSVTWNGGETEKVVWSDDGAAPKLQEIQGFVTVDLMAGGSTNQVFVKTIGQTVATAKEIGFTVPKDVGPPGNFYFIKYTAGTYAAFSGLFSIENVNGKIDGFDPKNPNVNPDTTNSTVPSPVPSPASPSSIPSASSSPTGETPKTDPKSSTNDPYGSGSSSTSGSGNSPASGSTNSLPSEISAATKLLSSLPGVASAAVALTFIYLY